MVKIAIRVIWVIMLYVCALFWAWMFAVVMFTINGPLIK